MSLQIDIAWLIAALLVSVRIASAIAFVPVLGPSQLPASVQVMLAIGMGALIASAGPTASVNIVSVLGLAVAVFREAAIGASFAFGFLTAYAGTQIAGRALDIQIGFGAASVLNPAAVGVSPLLGTLFGMSMVAVFLAVDGHHLLFKALSAVSIPASAGVPVDASRLILQSGSMFVFGLAFAAPVMFALWLSDVAMAVFARSMPQLNVFVLSFAVKILIGLSGLALSVSVSRSLLENLLNSTFRYWERLAAQA